MPGALALRAQAHRARRQLDLEARALLEQRRSSGSPAGRRRRRRARSCARGARMPFSIAIDRQVVADRRRSRRARPRPASTPERHRRRALRLGGVVEPAPAGRRVRAAGVRQHRAQRVQAAALLADQHRRRRRAGGGEARRADRPLGVADEQPDVRVAARLDPARDAGRAEAARAARRRGRGRARARGAGTQREWKNGCGGGAPMRRGRRAAA